MICKRTYVGVAFGIALLMPPVHAMAQCGGSWLLRSTPTTPPNRYLHGMAFDSARGVTVMFGGQSLNPNTVLNDTWEWNGTDWTNRTAPGSPPARIACTMAYDSNRNVTVLFGGSDNNVVLADTWEWDGTSWTQKNPATAPSARAYPVMAYDSERKVMVLFGGFDNANLLQDTWEWDGTNWINRNTVPSPSIRAGHMMAYDSPRKKTVLFGGLLNPATLTASSAETWEWDGTKWTQILAAQAPAARWIAAMSFDSGRSQTVLFGGITDNINGNNETWEWDGVNWVKLSPSASPSIRAGASMVYDTKRLVSVLFGGVSNSAAFSETWEFSVPTIQITQQPAAQSVAAGQTATFTVAANSGPVAISFAWRHNGQALADGGSISGSSTATLTIGAVSAANMGDYDCEISHACQKVLSQIASLTIPGPPGAQAVPCGVCGGGTAAMMPLGLLGWTMARSRRLVPKRRRSDSASPMSVN